jgi:triosephosphate isomerase
MLSKLGCTYAVIGHSERRQYHNEPDAVVNAKVKAAYKHGLVPIMCIGEVKEERESGQHVEVTLGQLRGGLVDIPAEDVASIVIAYEPVWAIGTGLTATAQDAQDMCAAIRAELANLYSQEIADGIRIQYGGSVKAANAAEIMAGADVDGALIGGASLDADEFVAIAKYRLA